jgi:hypothetical protein
MSQSNYNVPNDSAPAVRSQFNSIFGSIATNNSGSSAPSTTFAHQWWYDTTANILKMRNTANSAWINVAYFDQGAGAFRILDDTQVVNTSGVQTGLIGDQATATWEAGTSTVESLVSPAKVAAAVAALGASTSSVLAATAGATAGAVGTYVFARRTTGTGDVAFGSTLAGSALSPVSASATVSSNSNAVTASFAPGSALSGTWRAMGAYDHSAAAGPDGSGNTVALGGATLWLRIS